MLNLEEVFFDSLDKLTEGKLKPEDARSFWVSLQAWIMKNLDDPDYVSAIKKDAYDAYKEYYYDLYEEFVEQHTFGFIQDNLELEQARVDFDN